MNGAFVVGTTRSGAKFVQVKDASEADRLAMVAVHSVTHSNNPWFVAQTHEPGAPEDGRVRTCAVRVEMPFRPVMQRRVHPELDVSAWRYPLTDGTRAFFRAHNELVLRTVTTPDAGVFLDKTLRPQPCDNMAARYMKAAVGADYARALARAGVDPRTPRAQWTADDAHRVRAVNYALMTDVDDAHPARQRQRCRLA